MQPVASKTIEYPEPKAGYNCQASHKSRKFAEPLAHNNQSSNVLTQVSSFDIMHQYPWRIEGASHPSYNKKDVKHFYPENHIKSKAPPSTLMFCPFMNCDSFEIKNNAAFATSFPDSNPLELQDLLYLNLNFFG